MNKTPNALYNFLTRKETQRSAKNIQEYRDQTPDKKEDQNLHNIDHDKNAPKPDSKTRPDKKTPGIFDKKPPNMTKHLDKKNRLRKPNKIIPPDKNQPKLSDILNFWKTQSEDSPRSEILTRRKNLTVDKNVTVATRPEQYPDKKLKHDQIPDSSENQDKNQARPTEPQTRRPQTVQERILALHSRADLTRTPPDKRKREVSEEGDTVVREKMLKLNAVGGVRECPRVRSLGESVTCSTFKEKNARLDCFRGDHQQGGQVQAAVQHGGGRGGGARGGGVPGTHTIGRPYLTVGGIVSAKNNSDIRYWSADKPATK